MYYRNIIINELNININHSILDYGCGRGDFTQLLISLTKETVTAVDNSAKMIEHISARFIDEKIETVLVSQPGDLKPYKFDRILCHNVLECVDDKVNFINEFRNILAPKGILILSHFDFDSCIYNSSYKELTRDLIHKFSDYKGTWQQYADGQIGRKMLSLMKQSCFTNYKHKLIRLTETDFSEGNYGHLMTKMLIDVGKHHYSIEILNDWQQDLEDLYAKGEYFFAIDLFIIKIL